MEKMELLEKIFDCYEDGSKEYAYNLMLDFAIKYGLQETIKLLFEELDDKQMIKDFVLAIV